MMKNKCVVSTRVFARCDRCLEQATPVHISADLRLLCDSCCPCSKVTTTRTERALNENDL